MEIEAIIRAGGGASKLAKALGCHHSSVLGWKRVPAHRVPEVARITKLGRHQLRSDLWEEPPAQEPAEALPARAA